MISAIIAQGIGFGGVTFIPTLGFTPGAAPVQTAPPLIADAIDFAFTQGDTLDFPFTQSDVIDFLS